MNYLDTSALIKRFVSERGSEAVHALMSRGDPVATAKIGYAEVHAGFARKRRERRLSESDYALACLQFERDWAATIRVDLRDDILFLVRDLIRRHPLRGFDAVHLASAVFLGRQLGEEVTFFAADARLLRAAAREGLGAVNAEEKAST